MYKALKKRKSSCTFAGDINLYSHYGEEDGGSSKIKNIITIRSSNSNCEYIFKGNENRIAKRYLHPMFIAALFTIAKT